MRSRVYVTVGCPSVRLSTRLSVPLIDSSSGVRLVCCWARAPVADIDSWYCSRQPAANVGSVMSRAEGRGSSQTCLVTGVLIVVWEGVVYLQDQNVGKDSRTERSSGADEAADSAAQEGQRRRCAESRRTWEADRRRDDQRTGQRCCKCVCEIEDVHLMVAYRIVLCPQFIVTRLA